MNIVSKSRLACIGRVSKSTQAIVAIVPEEAGAQFLGYSL